MADVLLDTDVLIDHLRIGRPVRVPPSEAAYSSITRAELYAGRRADEAVIDDLLVAFQEIPVEREIAERAGRIRRETDMALPDCLVAATAIFTRRSLLTRNVRHFGRVPGLRVRAPR